MPNLPGGTPRLYGRRDARHYSAGLKHGWCAFFENFYLAGKIFFLRNFPKPARWFIQFLEGKFERAVVHRNEMAGAEVFESFHGLIRAHMDFAERVRVICADGQQGDLRRLAASDFFEAVEVGAVAGVIKTAALVFQNKSAIAAMLVAQSPRAPMFAGRQRDFPIVMREAFPPFQFDDAFEAEVEGQIADAPGHDADFRVGEAAERGLVEMIEVRVREEDEIDRRQVLDFQSGTLDAFQEEKPVGEVRVDQDIQVRELHQE